MTVKVILQIIQTVLNTWKSEFNELYKGYENSEFDTNFYEYAQAEQVRLESNCINMNEGNYKSNYIHRRSMQSLK